MLLNLWLRLKANLSESRLTSLSLSLSLSLSTNQREPNKWIEIMMFNCQLGRFFWTEKEAVTAAAEKEKKREE